MPSPAHASPPVTRRSSRSTATDGWSPSRPTSVRRWSAPCSLLLALAGGLAGAACRAPAPTLAPDDASLRPRVRLLRIDDTRRDEPAFLDSVIAGAMGDANRGRAALTAGRLGARMHLPALRR